MLEPNSAGGAKRPRHERHQPGEPCAGGSAPGTGEAPVRPRRRGKRLALDAQATEAISHFAWLLARSGFSREEAARTFRSVCRAIPAHVGDGGIGSGHLTDEAGQVITLWYMTSGYLDRRGKPLPLPLEGPAPSLEALTRQVSPKLNVAGVLKFLNAGNSLIRRGNLYLPRGRAVTLRAKTPFQIAHNLRAVTGLLRSVEHNSRGRPQWFEFCAHGMIPVGQVRRIQRDFIPKGMQMLQYADAVMLRRSLSGKGRGKHVRLAVGVYVFEERPLPPETARRKNGASDLSPSTARVRQRGQPVVRRDATAQREAGAAGIISSPIRRRDSRAAGTT
jgi:hypothetical protein